jgi:hypothetical protein
MNERIEAFISEVRNMPEFAGAVAAGFIRVQDQDGLERAFSAIDRLANDDSAFIPIVDSLRAIVSRRDLSLMARVQKVGEVLVQARDKLKKAH